MSSMKERFAGPCAHACKPGAGTGNTSTVFESIKLAAQRRYEEDGEAGLFSRPDRTYGCPSCDAAVRQPGQICDACLQARADERAAGWGR